MFERDLEERKENVYSFEDHYNEGKRRNELIAVCQYSIKRELLVLREEK